MDFEIPTAAVFAGVGLSKMFTALNQRYRSNLHRAAQLREAEKLLILHYDALDQFMSDPASPSNLKDVMMWFSDASADKEVACEILAMAFESKKEDDAADTTVGQELKALAKHRQDLVDLFEKAIRTGVIATYLRWDEMAKLFERLVANNASNPHPEIKVAVRAARFEKRHAAQSSMREPAMA